MKSLLMPELTPVVVVTSAGPDWLKVNSKERGVGSLRHDPNHYKGFYWIATEVDGSKEFKKITDLARNFFCTREYDTNWFWHRMPSYSWTGNAGKKLPRPAELLRAERWVTDNS
jgi:hypothetical protein